MTSEELDAEFLTDHEYDGIREYDNPLPGWWVWTFWATVVFCIPYWLYIHTASGNTLEDEYLAEIEAYETQFQAMYGDLAADVPTILTYMQDDVAMATMRSLFLSKCASCHLPDGGGIVGPNLTDDHWINVVDLTDIHRVLVEGVIPKGMQAWKGVLSDTQLVLMSSYIATLRANPMAGKEPQGEVIPAWPTSAEETGAEETSGEE